MLMNLLICIQRLHIWNYYHISDGPMIVLIAPIHYNDVIMGTMASQITGLTIVYSTVYSGADQKKHQSSASLALVRGIHRGPVNSPRKWPVTRKMFPFDDVIMRVPSWFGGYINTILMATESLQV